MDYAKTDDMYISSKNTLICKLEGAIIDIPF